MIVYIRMNAPMNHSSAHNLKNVGLKATLPRMQVLEIMRGSAHRHLSAEDIYHLFISQGRKVSLATVYRVLSQLETVGLLSRNVFNSGKAYFEINEGHHYDHLICIACGRVEEFSNEGIEALQHDVAIRHSFELAGHSLALYGHCADCNAAEMVQDMKPQHPESTDGQAARNMSAYSSPSHNIQADDPST